VRGLYGGYCNYNQLTGRHYEDDTEEEAEDKKEKMLKAKVQVDLKKIYKSVYSTHKSATLTEDSRR
jgi:hypothetical protein